MDHEFNKILTNLDGLKYHLSMKALSTSTKLLIRCLLWRCVLTINWGHRIFHSKCDYTYDKCSSKINMMLFSFFSWPPVQMRPWRTDKEGRVYKGVPAHGQLLCALQKHRPLSFSWQVNISSDRYLIPYFWLHS